MDKKKNQWLLYAGAALLVAAAAFSFKLYPTTPEELTPQNSKTYTSGRYGITFQYPSNYRLTQKEAGSAEREHHVITLVDQAVGTIPENSDGSPSITIDIFENDKDSLSSRDFITATSNSNYKLGGGSIATSTYGEVTGLEYAWSGLYEGRSLVIARPGYVFMFSGTRNSSGDPISSDFERILKTVVLK